MSSSDLLASTLALTCVVAILLSDIASKTDEIFSCKKAHYTCRQLLVRYICNKSMNKDTCQYALTKQ